MDFLKPNSTIKVHAYKFNGDIYRSWEYIKVLRHNAKELVLINKWALITEIGGQKWKTREPAVWFFRTGEWNNIICIFKNTGISYYINIASPFIIEEGAVKYIDYDLDVRVFSDGTYEVLDLRDYEQNQSKYKYPENTVKSIWNELNKMEKAVINKVGIFSHEEALTYQKFFKNKFDDFEYHN